MKKLFVKLILLLAAILSVSFNSPKMQDVVCVCAVYLLSMAGELFSCVKIKNVAALGELALSLVFAYVNNSFNLAFVFAVYDLCGCMYLSCAYITAAVLFSGYFFGVRFGGISAAAGLLVSMTAMFRQKADKLEKELLTQRDVSEQEKIMLHKKNTELISAQNTAILNATLRERNRIAREIHDNVGHMLTRSILQLGAVNTVNKAGGDIEPMLNVLEATLTEAMTNIRQSVHDLHDESIDINAAVRDIAKDIKKPRINLKIDVGMQVDNSLKYDLLAIIKEGINNTVKHSDADKLDIELTEHHGFFKLCMHDNGTVPITEFTGGIGISNMRERVSSRKGNISFTYDNGFKIYAVIMKGKNQ